MYIYDMSYLTLLGSVENPVNPRILAQAQHARDNGELDRIKEQKANTQVLNSKAQEYAKKLEKVEVWM